MLDPVILKDRCTKDSLSLCKEIKKVSSTNKFLASYDIYIYSLFTISPLNKTIDLTVKPNIKIRWKDLKKDLFEFGTSGTHILFDRNYYDQLDGIAIAIGSLLGPVIADLFMGFYEK